MARKNINYSSQDLIEKAHGCLERVPPKWELAERFYEKALSKEPENPDVLDTFGDFLCNKGDFERATELLQKSVQIRPNEAGQKYFNLGQMVEGREALGLYEKGITLLAAELLAREVDEVKPKSEVVQGRPAVPSWQLRKQLVSGYCSVCELYMTDLCDEPEAESACEFALKNALLVDQESFEALAAYALLKKTQGNLEESRSTTRRALKSLSALDPDIRDDDATMSQDNASKKEGGGRNNNEELIPTSDSRIGLCRTMIDLEMTQEAQGLLSRLLQEDDEEPQVWYLLACAHGVERDVEAVAECVERFESLLALAPEFREQWEAPLRELKEKFLQQRSTVASSPDGVATGPAEYGDVDAMDVNEMDC